MINSNAYEYRAQCMYPYSLVYFLSIVGYDEVAVGTRLSRRVCVYVDLTSFALLPARSRRTAVLIFVFDILCAVPIPFLSYENFYILPA